MPVSVSATCNPNAVAVAAAVAALNCQSSKVTALYRLPASPPPRLPAAARRRLASSPPRRRPGWPPPPVACLLVNNAATCGPDKGVKPKTNLKSAPQSRSAGAWQSFVSLRHFSSCEAALRRLCTAHHSSGPFVYRLGHQVFNLVRGVRLPYGLPLTHFFAFLSIGCDALVSNQSDRLDRLRSASVLDSPTNPLSASRERSAFLV